MRSRRVVVCTNLKPAKMRDVISYGMVRCSTFFCSVSISYKPVAEASTTALVESTREGSIDWQNLQTWKLKCVEAKANDDIPICVTQI